MVSRNPINVDDEGRAPLRLPLETLRTTGGVDGPTGVLPGPIFLPRRITKGERKQRGQRAQAGEQDRAKKDTKWLHARPAGRRVRI